MVLVVHERPLFNRERQLGIYCTFAYHVARVAATIPFLLVLPTIYVLLSYFLAGLAYTAESFFKTMCVLLLSALAGNALGSFIGSLVRNTTLALAVTGVCVQADWVLMENRAAYVTWFAYLSISGRGRDACLYFYFAQPGTYSCDDSNFIPQCATQTTVPNSDILAYFSPTLTYAWSLGVLILFFVGYQTLTFIAQKYLYRDAIDEERH